MWPGVWAIPEVSRDDEQLVREHWHLHARFPRVFGISSFESQVSSSGFEIEGAGCTFRFKTDFSSVGSRRQREKDRERGRERGKERARGRAREKEREKERAQVAAAAVQEYLTIRERARPEVSRDDERLVGEHWHLQRPFASGPQRLILSCRGV